jgi:hypothetical protein
VPDEPGGPDRAGHRYGEHGDDDEPSDDRTSPPPVALSGGFIHGR